MLRTRQLPLAFASLFAVLCFSTSALAGYTHYWKWSRQPDPIALKSCISEMHAILEASKDIVAGPDGTGVPIFEESELHFNGVGAGSHESFSFPGQEGFNFCKTELKPYDRVVTACLLVAGDHFPTSMLQISSDGQWAAGDWNEGARLYSSALRRSAHDPLHETTSSTAYLGGSMFMAFFGDFLPWIPTILILIVFIVFMKRANFGSHVSQQREHMAKAQIHMETVETLLTRIAEALEKQGK